MEWNLYNKTGEILLNAYVSAIVWHSLYRIMFIIPVGRDHLSSDTTQFTGRFIQVSQ